MHISPPHHPSYLKFWILPVPILCSRGRKTMLNPIQSRIHTFASLSATARLFLAFDVDKKLGMNMSVGGCCCFEDLTLTCKRCYSVHQMWRKMFARCRSPTSRSNSGVWLEIASWKTTKSVLTSLERTRQTEPVSSHTHTKALSTNTGTSSMSSLCDRCRKHENGRHWPPNVLQLYILTVNICNT